MRPHPSVALRALRGLVVLVTVWCTGCTGFEPLIAATLGRSTMGMVCGSDEGEMVDQSQRSGAGAVDGLWAAPTALSVPPASPEGVEFSCGCTSCHTVAPVMWSFGLLPAPALPPFVTTALTLVSVSRVPLLPPPERAAS
jgi:hypothetical protein